MAIITLRLTAVNSKPAERPVGCRYCGHSFLHKWGTVRKPVRDTQFQQVWVQRYRCCRCRRTFRHYPLGVEGADQSLRLQQWAAIGWTLGLSTRGVSGLLGAFRVSLAHMSVWRDVQKLSQQLGKRSTPPVRVLGVDGVYGRVKGQPQAMTIAVDLGNGQLLAVGRVDEHDPQQVVAWLKPLQDALGVEVIVTDDLHEYAQVAEHLGLQQQVCHFHLQRWVGKALRSLAPHLSPEGQAALVQVRELVHALPATGRTTLFELYARLPAERQVRGARPSPLMRLRQLVLRLSEQWDRYCLYQTRSDVPATNNRTEQAIGRWRTRSRSVRGFKSWAGLSSAFVLSGCPIF